MGGAIRFIPHPLVTGFTSGIAVIIFSGEIKDFFGLRMGTVPVAFFAKWVAYAKAAPTANVYALGIAALAFAIILLWPRVSRRIPGPFVALVVTLLARALHLPVAPLFGGIPATGATARTATNVKNGGRTPVAGIVHAVTLLLITLFVWADGRP